MAAAIALRDLQRSCGQELRGCRPADRCSHRSKGRLGNHAGRTDRQNQWRRQGRQIRIEGASRSAKERSSPTGQSCLADGAASARQARRNAQIGQSPLCLPANGADGLTDAGTKKNLSKSMNRSALERSRSASPDENAPTNTCLPKTRLPLFFRSFALSPAAFALRRFFPAQLPEENYWC